MFSGKETHYDQIQKNNIFQRLSKIEEAGKLGYWEYDATTETIWWSDNVFRLLNRDPLDGAPTYEQMLLDYDKQSRKLLESSVEKALTKGENYELELYTSQRTGIPKHIKATGVVEKDTNGTKLFGIIQDISKLKASTNKLTDVVSAKDLQFKELHHRIKNNLNMVNSLLHLKSKMATEHETKEVIQEVRHQIMAMARTHEQLMRLEKYDFLSTRSFLVGWVESIMETTQSQITKYTLDMQVEDHEISTDTMLALGLIIQEIIANIFKYAYDPDTGGKVYVRLAEKEECLLLLVGDKGRGMQTIVNKDRVGTRLMNALVNQINGNIALHQENGVQYIISFPRSASNSKSTNKEFKRSIQVENKSDVQMIV